MIASMDRRAFLFACSSSALAPLTNLDLHPDNFIRDSTSMIGLPNVLPEMLHGANTSERTYITLGPAGQWASRMGFALDPPVTEWEKVEGKDAGQTVYTGGGYRLRLDSDRPESHALAIRFHLQRDDGRNFTVLSYSVSAQLSLVGIYRIWNYRGGPAEALGEVDVFTRGLAANGQVSGANIGIPIIVLTDREGCNQFTFGMLDQVEIADLQINNYSLGFSERGEGLNYSFEFVKPAGYAITRSRLDDGVWFNTKSISWFDVVKCYTRWVETTSNIAVLHPPKRAYDPIWNTWYPYGQDINEKIILESAGFCQKIGITNIFIDAGYNNSLHRGMSTPQDIELFNDHTGDWIADKGKFPDFCGLIDRLHQQGQIVTIWVALFLLGKDTHAYRNARHLLMHDKEGKETLNLCPCHPDTPGYLSRTFLQMAKKYDLDGYWLDFMDSLHIPCYAPHAHFTSSPGEGYNRCLTAVRDAILKWKPNFLIETRMKMSNINMKQFSNVLETYDMPFDFDLNRGMGVFVKSFSSGVATKLDPVQWHMHESNENVAKLCATVILMGIPVFGVDFKLLPQSHVKVMKAWIKFYRAHQEDLISGEFTPIAFAPLFPEFQVRNARKIFLYIGSSSMAPANVLKCDEVYIINVSDTDRVTLSLDNLGLGHWHTSTCNCFLETIQSGDIVNKHSSTHLDRAIPQGGYLALRKGKSNAQDQS